MLIGISQYNSDFKNKKVLFPVLVKARLVVLTVIMNYLTDYLKLLASLLRLLNMNPQKGKC